MAAFVRRLASRRMLLSLVIGAAATQAAAQQTITQKAKDQNKSFDADVAQWV